ncbi:hypothetical protein [Sphingomonas aquatilis]|uniref:Uncharacterized protein n=1 Tax=Sphingomonas aquatilis TaxID=93063 RepID=A0AAW3TRS6_9SPHN|nr:hypothetical protein [Sphingomonas aquatilis]MBB3875282.1 hypothetical protein [Sphingomonas aquatilis]
MNIDTSGWGPFNPNDAHDAACERERLAWTEHTLRRLRKAPKTGSTEEAIWTGGIMAIVQIAYAMHVNTPPDSAREALHQALDFAWLQCASMAMSKGEQN